MPRRENSSARSCGLYGDEGLLDHVGFTSSFREAERKMITNIVERLVRRPGFTGHAPGGPSHWSTRRSDEWKPLQPSLVVEVKYNHFIGGRFRRRTRLLRCSHGGGFWEALNRTPPYGRISPRREPAATAGDRCTACGRGRRARWPECGPTDESKSRTSRQAGGMTSERIRSSVASSCIIAPPASR